MVACTWMCSRLKSGCRKPRAAGKSIRCLLPRTRRPVPGTRARLPFPDSRFPFPAARNG